MAQILAKPKNPAFEKTHRRGPDGRFLPLLEKKNSRAGAVQSAHRDVDDQTASTSATFRTSRLEGVLGRHRTALKEIAARHGAKSIAIVGSVARGEDTADSDYDFLVDFGKPTGVFAKAGLRIELREYLGERVDLIHGSERFRSEGRCAPSMLREAIQL